MKFRPRVTSAAVVGAQAPAPPSSKPEKHRCYSCGVGLPRRIQRLCSYCIGDPSKGYDGYFADMIADEITLIEQLTGKTMPPAYAEGWRRDLSHRSAWEAGPYEARRALR